jgi:hypothetical protein
MKNERKKIIACNSARVLGRSTQAMRLSDVTRVTDTEDTYFFIIRESFMLNRNQFETKNVQNSFVSNASSETDRIARLISQLHPVTYTVNLFQI